MVTETFDDGGPYNESFEKEFKREILFPGGRYEMCAVVYSDEIAKLMFVRDSRGEHHIARPYLGTWGAFSLQDVYHRMVLEKQPPIIEHGFDIVHLGNYENWFSIKLANELEFIGKSKDGNAFEWKTKGDKRVMYVTTQANPETGEYGPGNRPKDIGFASYIGITGPEDKVDRFVKHIKLIAESIKDESLGKRSFI